MEKRGEPGIFSHVSDVTTNDKIMNVGGLKLNGVIAHALVSAKMVESFCVSCLRTELCDFVQSVRFCRRLKTEKHERIAGVSLPLSTLHFVLSQKGCL